MAVPAPEQENAVFREDRIRRPDENCLRLAQSASIWSNRSDVLGGNILVAVIEWPMQAA